jgi:hypothetical protein
MALYKAIILNISKQKTDCLLTPVRHLQNVGHVAHIIWVKKIIFIGLTTKTCPHLVVLILVPQNENLISINWI